MYSLFKNEITKLFLRKKIYVFSFILFIIPIVFAFSFKGIESNGAIDLTKSFGPMTTTNFMLTILEFESDLLLPIFIIVFLGEMITEESSGGMLKYILITPISRFQYLVSKIFATLVTILILVASSFIFSLILGTIFFGGDVDFSIVKSFGLYTIVLFAISMFIMFISILFEKSSTMIGASIGLIILMTIIGGLSKTIGKYIITSYVKVFKYINVMSSNDVIIFSVTTLIYIAIFVVASTLSLNKRDICT